MDDLGRLWADLEGSLVGDEASPAVAQLRREGPSRRVLGSYPARTTASGAVDRRHDGG